LRTTSWSEGTRKGTFHTTSTNLSSSNHGNAANSSENQRLRNANLSVNNNSIKSIERAPLNVIKYVKIVVEEKIVNFESQDMLEISDCESNANTKRDGKEEIPEKNVNKSNNNSINSYPNKQKSNYSCTDNVKISIKSCNNDKCLPDVESCDDEIDSVASEEKDFCINIYNLLSAKESLV
jgi:hypothetical protein